MHTVEIENILARCFEHAKRLRHILDKLVVVDGANSRKKRIKKAIVAKMKYQEIAGILNTLERYKGALSLCIQTIDT